MILVMQPQKVLTKNVSKFKNWLKVKPKIKNNVSRPYMNKIARVYFTRSSNDFEGLMS